MDTILMILAIWLGTAAVATIFIYIAGRNYQDAKASWKAANRAYYNEGGRAATIHDLFGKQQPKFKNTRDWGTA